MKRLLSLLTLLILGSITHAQDTPVPKVKVIHFSVTDLENQAALKKAEATLTGISQLQSDPKTGTLTLTYDPTKANAATLQKNLTDSGLKITGQQTTFRIKGLMCQSCANHLTSVLGKTAGLVNLDQISHLTGLATLTFNPKKTDEAKLKAAIHTTQYKVVEAPK